MPSLSPDYFFKACRKGDPEEKAVTVDRENDRWEREKPGALISP
jgi:hypothetical protein